MGRWGAASGPPPPPPTGPPAVQERPGSPEGDEAAVSPRRMTRRRWSGQAGAVPPLAIPSPRPHGDAPGGDATTSRREGLASGRDGIFRVGFRFGDENAAAVSDQGGDGDGQISIPDATAPCANCDHLQDIYAHAVQDPLAIVVCDQCGLRKPAKMWLWQTLPEIERSAAGVTYHTPYYQQKLDDLVHLARPTLPENIVTHTTRPIPGGGWKSTGCIYGKGDIATYQPRCFGGAVIQHSVRNPQWEGVQAVASGGALAVAAVQQVLRDLAIPAVRLGEGFFDNLCVRPAHLARVQDHSMPRFRHFQHRKSGGGNPAAGGDLTFGPMHSSGSNNDAAQGQLTARTHDTNPDLEMTIPQQDPPAAGDAGEAEEALMGNGDATNRPVPRASPAAIMEKTAWLRDVVATNYRSAVAQLSDQTQAAMLRKGFRCCVPLEYMLKGIDGSADPAPPPILMHHVKPLEQRLMRHVIDEAADPMRYLEAATGTLVSHYDPLLEHPIAAFDDDVVLAGKDANYTIPTVCTREGPSRRDGSGTFQLDVHIATVLFTSHVNFREAEQRLGRMLYLYHECRRLATQSWREKGKAQDAEEAHPLKPALHPSRHAAERRVEDLINHLVRSACSGVHGATVRTKGIAVANKWKPRHSDDGVFGSRTAGALEDYLSVMVPHPVDCEDPFDDEHCADCLTPLGPHLLASLRFHLGREGSRILRSHADGEALLAGVPAAWWEQAEATIPVPGFGVTDRMALQAFLKAHFACPGAAINEMAVDGVIRADTVSALQTYLLNTRPIVQQGLMLPALIARLEVEMREVGAEVEVHRQLADARRARDHAVAADAALIRELLEEWHALKHLCGGEAPPGVVFGLVQRYPAPDHALAVTNASATQAALQNRVPYLEIAEDASLHPDLHLSYKCKLFVRLKAGEGSRFAAETEWKPLHKDLQVRMGAVVRLHLAKEPEEVMIQVMQRGAVKGLVRGTSYGHVTITPPFSCNPFEPGGAQHRNLRWFPFKSDMGKGRLLAEAFWSQHDKAVPSRAPQPSGHFHAADAAAVKVEILEGRIDPNDPQYQALVRWLAERDPEDPGARKAAERQKQEGPLRNVLLPPPPAPTRSGCVRRNDLLRNRWELITNPASADLNGSKLDKLLVGPETRKPVPFVPREVEWGRPAERRSSSITDATKAGAMPDTNTWLAKIRRAKAKRVTGYHRDVELLSQTVTQPLEEEERSCLDVLADFFKPISKLRPYRQTVQEVPVSVFTEQPVLMVYIKNGRNIPVRCHAHLLEGEHEVKLARPRGSGFGSGALGLGSPHGSPHGSAQRDQLGSMGADGNLRMRGAGRTRSGSPAGNQDGGQEAPGGAGNAEDAEADLFVEVRFGPTELQCTRTAIGPDPLFFETLRVTIPFQHLTADSLALIEDPLEIRVFDRIKSHRRVPDLHEPADGNTVNYFEIKRFIGSCIIPLNTLYGNAKATWEGTLQLDTPPVGLGYAHPSDLPKGGNDGPTVGDRMSSLSLYVTLQPKVHNPPHVDEFDPLHSSEPGPVFWHAQRWTTSLRSLVGKVVGMATLDNQGSTRKERITPLVHDTDTRATLICRYVSSTGLKPPPVVYEYVEGMEFACARMVSLIPHAESVNISEDDGGRRWTTSAEFLRAGAGDYDEHAVLLANYFQDLCYAPYQRFLEVYVVFARTDQYIRVSFVLTRCALTQAYHLWDPVRGTRSPLSSTRQAGLRDVSLVFDHKNVWCNIQPSGVPAQMDWDLGNRASWRPMFDGLEAPQASCQTVLRPLYAPVHPEDLTALQLNIADEVKALLRELRSTVRTYLTSFRNLVDLHGRRVLDDILLPAFEDAHVEGYCKGRGEGGDGEEAWLEAKHQELLSLHKGCLQEALASYEMHGVPFHFAWRDGGLAIIKKEIACSAVHATDPMERNVEFALGVRVRGYASVGGNDFISVWVYVAQMRRATDRWPGGVRPGGRRL